MWGTPLYARCGACGAEFDVGTWRDDGGRIQELEAFAAAYAACDRQLDLSSTSIASDA